MNITGNAWVADTARVADNAWVTDNALVTSNARVTDYAQVSDYAQVTDYAQVSGHARVYGNARVTGNSKVAGNGDISSTRHVLTVGPVGSEGRHVSIHRHYDGPDSQVWGHLVVAGCWRGTLDELAARISGTGNHGWSREDEGPARADYEGFIALARVRVAEWKAEPLTQADHDRWAR